MKTRDLIMERFLVQVYGDCSYYDPMRHLFLLNECGYEDFRGVMADLGLLDDFNREILISCELCGSYIMGAGCFCHFIDRISDLMSRSRLFLDRYPDLAMLYSDLAVIASHLKAGASYQELGVILNPVCICSAIIAQ
jgi:hypothetical protein